MASKYSVAVVAACPFPYPRGTPIRILRMAESLVARGHHVDVITYHLGQRVEDLTFPVHRIPYVPTYRKLSPGPTYQKVLLLDTLLSMKIWSVVRSGRFDVIHAHHYEGLLASLPVAQLMKIPVVFDMHTLLSSELPHYTLGLPSRWLRWIGQEFDHWLPPLADHIVTVTNTIRDKLIHTVGISTDKVTTVYSAMERDFLDSSVLDHSPPVPQTLIFTGNLAPYQGMDLMLRALRLILDRRPGTVLKIITQDPILPYQPLIDSLNLQGNLIVESTDYFHLPAKLHTAMVALNPRPQADGLPAKLLNYMATGRAIVSYEGSGEILEHEKTALLVPSGNVEAFAASILRLLDDPELAKYLGTNAQSVVNEFFVWEPMVRIIEGVYEKVVQR